MLTSGSIAKIDGNKCVTMDVMTKTRYGSNIVKNTKV